ncbi:uncharacterized protein AB675_8825 [Cyphellophora attinorum]|uniref:Uncharacterized protein n=1 Tax=Cyphellophora attinorum TaxID=1664694 RepID=A0A0N1P368_9EURO|nr:uncharacterized protein AB675_8825 [Phialophora attinorum]KPI44636.1 hypothetical protein AB675_8825 [Phialophora attinorum]
MRSTRQVGPIENDPEMQDAMLFAAKLEGRNWPNPRHGDWARSYREIQHMIEAAQSRMVAINKDINSQYEDVLAWVKSSFSEQLKERDGDRGYQPWSQMDRLLDAEEDVASILDDCDQEIQAEHGAQKHQMNEQTRARERFLKARIGLQDAQQALADHFARSKLNYAGMVADHKRRVDLGEDLPPPDTHITLDGQRRAKSVAAAESEYSKAATMALRLRAVRRNSSRFSSHSSHTERSEMQAYGYGGLGMPKDYSRIVRWRERVPGDAELDDIVWPSSTPSNRSESSEDGMDGLPFERRVFDHRTVRHLEKARNIAADNFKQMMENWDERQWPADKPKAARPDSLCVGRKRKRGDDDVEDTAAGEDSDSNASLESDDESGRAIAT